jgi:multiple antibiotic resistance protein
MSQTELAVNFFIALFALLDPVGNVPIFAAATTGASGQARRMIAVYVAVFSFAFLLFFYFTGLALLEFFGISLAAFRIAGGVLLFLLGLEMAREDFTAAFADPSGPMTEGSDPRMYARRSFERLIVPFAMPLLIGPGAISTVIIYAGEAKRFGLYGSGLGVAAIAGVCIATLLVFWLAGPISRRMGRIGTAIVVRVLGLVLCALAIQFIIIGLDEATLEWINPAAVNPYEASTTH